MGLNQFLSVNPNGQTPPRETAACLRNTQRGKLNCLLEFTITPNAATTVITEADTPGAGIIGEDSCILPMPLTANAATELAAGTFRVTQQGVGTATFGHANNAQADRTFRLAIIG